MPERKQGLAVAVFKVVSGELPGRHLCLPLWITVIGSDAGIDCAGEGHYHATLARGTGTAVGYGAAAARSVGMGVKPRACKSWSRAALTRW